MKPAESPFIHVVRSVILLGMLIVVPGIAVFWNHLPKNPVYKAEPSSVPSPSMPSEAIYPALSAIPIPSTVQPAVPQAIQHIAREHTPSAPASAAPDFAALEYRLKSLGATYYQLEKWGDRGELFRFVCLVAPSGAYGYEKHFQSIGTDAMALIQSVIADIEAWKM
ncbi:MAG: hypothetical protein FWG73_08305 [Planctomycetaceae bacterium]|nr:hypothetical protein [Planctomycetaceae bacterium]